MIGRNISTILNIDYQSLGYVFDGNQFDRLEEVAPDYDIEYFSHNGNKLFGYPTEYLLGECDLQ